MLKGAQEAGRDLFEYEAKSLLAEHGIQVPQEQVVRSPEEFAAVVATWADKSLAMKVVSKDILHKSDAGGVKLNLSGEPALKAAYEQILASSHAYAPEADIEGVLVTPMAEKGVEVIIGMLRDPVFGAVLMFGLGGIFVEILEDVAFRAVPLSRFDAASMVEQIKAKKVFKGVRGAAAIDRDALIDLLIKVSAIIEAYPQISELDLNPVIAYPDGYTIVDARVIVERSDPTR